MGKILLRKAAGKIGNLFFKKNTIQSACGQRLVLNAELFH